MKVEIMSLSLPEVKEEMKRLGEPAYRGEQIYSWIHQKLVHSFDEMTNLSQGLREKLKEEFYLEAAELLQEQCSAKDGTRKYLFGLRDGAIIESVMMPYHHGNSVCISSQVGCRMGCRFCASTIDGLERNLTPGEMLGQVYEIQRQTGERVSHVVIMGSGEPLDNYDNFVRFVRMISEEHGLHMSQRNITVSTCGLTEQIRKLSEEELAITLAISLHAPNDEIRKELMPVANKYTMEEVLDAVRFYFQKTGRRISFEYSIVHGVNDGIDHAKELAKRLRGLPCHVNLIPVNPIRERSFQPGAPAGMIQFKNFLEKSGINVTIRREMGADIDAACGQLRRRYKEETDR